MKRFLLFLLLTILLSACGKQTLPSVTSAPPTVAPSATPLPCNAEMIDPTSVPGDSLFPPVGPTDWVKGPANAAVTIITYNDFQCTQCNDYVLTSLAEAYPEDVRLVYRHFPQPDIFDKGLLAAQAAESASLQGKFWEMHDLLFARQADWVLLTGEEFKSWVGGQAESLGMDRAKFEADIENSGIVAKVQKAVEEGKAKGISVLPLVLLNGKIYSAPRDFASFDQVVRLTILGKKQFSACPQMEINPQKQYLAVLKTSKGDIIIELYADKAPLTVNSFVFLARHGWYDGNPFFLIIPDVLAQAGDPTGTGIGGPGYVFRDEIEPSLHFDKPGMVAMANVGPNTNGSQFFITFTAQPDLEGRSTIFGHVLTGMNILASLTPIDPSLPLSLAEGDIIISVSIEER